MSVLGIGGAKSAKKEKKENSGLLGKMNEAAEELIGKNDAIDVEEPDEIPAAQPEPQPAPQPEQKTNAPTTADDILAQQEQQGNSAQAAPAASSDNIVIVEAAQPNPTPSANVDVPEKETSAPVEPIQADDLIKESEAELKAHARHIIDEEEAKKVHAPIRKGEAQMRTRGFYEQIGDLAYEYDRTGEISDTLRGYVKSIITRDESLIDEIVHDYLPAIVSKNPGMVPMLKKMAEDTAKAHVDVKVLYVNAKDPEDETEYETWDAAKVSIQKEIDNYNVNPADVFQIVWRKIEKDGSLGGRMTADEVGRYIAYHPSDDKEYLKKVLCVKDKGDQKPKSSNKKSGSGRQPTGKKTRKPSPKKDNE